MYSESIDITGFHRWLLYLMTMRNAVLLQPKNIGKQYSSMHLNQFLLLILFFLFDQLAVDV